MQPAATRDFRVASLIHDIAEPTVTAGFSPLFPVLTALFHEVASLRGSLFVAPVFATLSIGDLFLVAAHLGGQWAAWLTAALTLSALLQIWFAKLPVPEMVTQYLVMTGLLAWLVSRRDHARRWAGAAGWFLGLACFAKVDLIVLLSVSLLAFGAWRLLARPECGTGDIGCLLVSFGLLLLHNGAHYLAFDSHYRPYVEYLIRTSYLSTLFRQAEPTGTVAAMVAGLFIAGLAAVVYRRPPRTRRRAWGVALAGILAARRERPRAHRRAHAGADEIEGPADRRPAANRVAPVPGPAERRRSGGGRHRGSDRGSAWKASIRLNAMV